MIANRKFCLLLAFGTIALQQAAGQAAVIGTATLKANPPSVPFVAPDAGLGSPWRSYALDISTTDGQLIGGIDVEIHGQLHQRWTYSDDEGDFVQTPNSAGQTNGDSHLRALTGALFGAGPEEDNSGMGSPLVDTATSDYGVGSYLRGAWGIRNAATTASVAYIVTASPWLIDLSITVADPGGNIIGRLTEYDFPCLSCGPGLMVDDFSYATMAPNEVVATTMTPNSPDIDWSGLTAPTYTPMFGAPDGAAGVNVPPVWNPETAQFSWNTNGSTRGRYTWDVMATHFEAGADTGRITIDVTQVPEPGSMVLALVSTCVGALAIARSNRRT